MKLLKPQKLENIQLIDDFGNATGQIIMTNAPIS